ncbi:MAG TPA: hypothetical protein VD963_06545 [Phycisphaerales bacterium]|nr:hypothetical protein [Phycisphaerales bacterium]
MDPVDRRFILAGAGLVGVTALARSARGGPIDPPQGPVSSTGRTLDQIYDKIAAGGEHGKAETRKPITSCPSSPNAQFVVTEPGVYYLPHNLTGEPNKCCIEIRASHVTIDGDDYTITGVPGTLACIQAVGDATSPPCWIELDSIAFRGWQGAPCCDLSLAGSSRIEGCWFDSCSSVDNNGLAGPVCVMGSSCVMYDCDARHCVGGMCSAGAGSVIEECLCADGSGGPAFRCEPGCTVEDNFVVGNDAPALVASGRCVVLYNRFVDVSGGVDVGPASVVEENDIECRPDAALSSCITIRGERCCVQENYCSGGGIVVLPGGNGTLIESNHLSGVSSGGGGGGGGGFIAVYDGATRCHISSNRCRNASTTSAFSIAPGNSYGPLVTVAGAGDISALPNSSHPEANFAC